MGERNRIEDVAASYVNLRRRGKNLVGLCPFHNEKTPSFCIYPENNSFFCFGCNKGGDVISFVMGVENLDLVRLRDDDCWHTATVDLRELTRRLPGVRMIKQWRFITGGNGRRGDQYWVDDFQIRRATADAGTDGD